jgi:chloramphenicol 3-O-phosphotransferase
METDAVTDLADAVIHEFQGGLRGKVLRPGDEGYDLARRHYNALIDKHPALIVQCAGVGDVMDAVTFGRTHHIVVAVRGGGHNVAGRALVDGGMVIDLSPMKGVRVGVTKPENGRVPLITGPSSVGKTAIAQELQRRLAGPWLIAGVDKFWGMLDERQLPMGEFRTDSGVMRRINRGWHRAVVALADEGNDVIVDDLLTHPWWLEDWRQVLSGLRWWSVVLTASRAVLTERETRRIDRPAGLAISDLARQSYDDDFDLVIDTTGRTVADCADAIADLMGIASS